MVNVFLSLYLPQALFRIKVLPFVLVAWYRKRFKCKRLHLQNSMLKTGKFGVVWTAEGCTTPRLPKRDTRVRRAVQGKVCACFVRVLLKVTFALKRSTNSGARWEALENILHELNSLQPREFTTRGDPTLGGDLK